MKQFKSLTQRYDIREHVQNRRRNREKQQNVQPIFRENMLENIEQNLIELMADYLDSDSVNLDEVIANVGDPVAREESELHIRMANAAFTEYKKTVTKRTGEQHETI